MLLAGLKLVAGNYSVAPADGTGAHLALDCRGHTRPFTLDLSNSTLVMQVVQSVKHHLRGIDGRSWRVPQQILSGPKLA